MKRGQVSIEYLVIMGFMFALLTPLIILFATTQRDTTELLVESQLTRVGESLRNAAERVYFAGAPAQEQITIYLPDNVQSINFSNTGIVFVVSSQHGSYDILVPSIAPLSGLIYTNRGIHIVNVTATNISVEIKE